MHRKRRDVPVIAIISRRIDTDHPAQQNRTRTTAVSGRFSTAQPRRFIVP
jgi:hypothetical protein